MQLLEQIAIGEEPVTEEDFFIHSTLMEAHFSKKDLQNPDTVKKILNQKYTFTSIIKYMAFLILGLAAVISIPTLAGPFVIMGWLTKINETLEAYPKKHKKEQLQKLEDQCNKLINQMEEEIEKNPGNASDCRKVISKCQDTIKTIHKRHKTIGNQSVITEIDGAIAIYNLLAKYIDKPRTLSKKEELGIYYLAQLLGIKESEITSIIVNKLYPEGEPYWYIGLCKSVPDSNGSKAASIIPEFKTNDRLYSIFSDENTHLVYSKMGKTYATISKDKFWQKTSLYEFSNRYKNSFPSKEAFIEADKSLGYYRLSKCPDAVIPKELNLK